MLGIGLVLGLATVLGLAHFTFCHTSSPQKPAPSQAPILPIALVDILARMSVLVSVSAL